MSKKYRILYLDDSRADIELVRNELERSGLEFELYGVSNGESYKEALSKFSPDVILSDHALPGFDSHNALEFAKTEVPGTPFILVTGSISEDYAVAIIKKGADDYILKDRLERIPTAIINAVSKSQYEKEKQAYLTRIIANESLMKEAEKMASFGSWQHDVINNKVNWSDGLYLILGFKPYEVAPSYNLIKSMVHPEDIHLFESRDKDLPDPAAGSFELSFRMIRKDGVVRYFKDNLSITRNDNNVPVLITGFMQDITEQRFAEDALKKSASDLLRQNTNLEQFAYIVSHNLRSPLSNIIGYLSLLNEMDLTVDEKNVLEKELFVSAEKLDEVIKDLNNILHMQNALEDKKEQVDFSLLLKDVTLSIDTILKKEEVEIISDFTEVPGLFTVRTYMHSIFLNLITNSIKYRRKDANPSIEIRSYKKKDKAGLIFKDNGLGIDLDKKGAQVFGLYKRFHSHIEGKGMGLFLVKTQVENLGGEITLISEINHGTEFKIEFNI